MRFPFLFLSPPLIRCGEVEEPIKRWNAKKFLFRGEGNIFNMMKLFQIGALKISTRNYNHPVVFPPF